MPGGETMPTYEYKCKGCQKVFTVHVSLKAHEKEPKPKCPKCAGKKVEQLFSAVSVVTAKKS
jgi:putative FmdB family regulatory protein